MLKGAFWATATLLIAPFLHETTNPSRLAALGPQLSIVAPQHVQTGHPIEIDVMLRGAPMVAGYEASVRYDEASAEFDGLVFGDGSGTGNVVTTMTTEPVGGMAYSEYTCVTSGCPAGDAAAARRALERVKIRIAPLAGTLCRSSS